MHVGLVANVLLRADNLEEFVNGINRRSHVLDASLSTKFSCSHEQVFGSLFKLIQTVVGDEVSADV